MLFRVLIIIAFSAVYIFPQSGLVRADDQVYHYLRYLKVSGVINNYNDVILPLSEKKVYKLLSSAGGSDYAKTYLRYYDYTKPLKNLWGNGEAVTFRDYLTGGERSTALAFEDSLFRMTANPVFNTKYYYSDLQDSPGKTAPLYSFGGSLNLQYKDFLDARLEAWNSVNTGTREIARLDPDVKRSYTFNETGLNYFDGTEGYLRYEDEIFYAGIGRNRILWGSGLNNKAVLSDNPQVFEYIQLGFEYKFLTYDYIHGWLVEPKTIQFIDSITGNIKNREPKYIASNRIGFRPGGGINFGITQTILYASRPFDAAYLNPFLFWESAQRAGNDLDNSFLTFDFSWVFAKGAEFFTSLTFDDINFEYLSPGQFDRWNNRLSLHTGLNITDALLSFLPKGWLLYTEYYFVRPHTYTHSGIGETMAYTNNSFALGVPLSPNSDMVNIGILMLPAPGLTVNLDIKYIRHGDNIYDENGVMIKNVGGSYFFNSIYKAYEIAPFLDGVRKDRAVLRLNAEYILSHTISAFLNFQHQQLKYEDSSEPENILMFGFKVNNF